MLRGTSEYREVYFIRHMLTGLRHFKALVAIMWLITR